MLTKKTKYALKALVSLARAWEDRKTISIAVLSRQQGISRKFLEAILLDLRKEGILDSKLGLGGGYFFKKNPAKVPLSKVLRATGGPIALLPCASLNYYEPCEDCENEKNCPVRNMAVEVRNATLAILNHTSVADLASGEKKKTTTSTRRKK